MITVDKDTQLNINNLCSWIDIWQQDLPRIQRNINLYKNNENGRAILALPFAKKISITSSSATVGDGITLSLDVENPTPQQEQTFEEVKRLFKKQTIDSHDRKVINKGCYSGKAYELVYMSDDEYPIPKVTAVEATNAFVVFDDTVERNSLFGVVLNEYTKDREQWYKCYIYDDVYMYTADVYKSDLRQVNKGNIDFENVIEHKIGRVPITEYHNNDELQADYEQVIGLMYDRTVIHDLNFSDAKKIAKNYLKARNISFVGDTLTEKEQTRDRMATTAILEFEALSPENDITIMSKNEDYSSINIFGEDMTSKIYDLSMVPDLSAEQFAGNQSGVALELKLLPFKQMVATKDEEIERLYRRRLKMYIHALLQKSSDYGIIDVGDISITINRNWSKNILEIAQTISTLSTTNLFSSEYLINLMPDAVAEDEILKKEKERESIADPMNASVEWLASALSRNEEYSEV